MPLLSVYLFILVGTALLVAAMLGLRLIRPRLDNATKAEPYECGEQPIGPTQVQFDLRFYVVALIYLVFAVEVVLFYPWAVAYGSAERVAGEDGAFTFRGIALADMLIFVTILAVGFAWLWRKGYLDFVRTRRSVRE